MKSKKLAECVVALLEDLEDQGAIERCHHGECRRLAYGLPDFGPCVEAPVCEDHVPQYAQIIPSLEDVTASLRALYVELGKHGFRYDPETGKRLS